MKKSTYILIAIIFVLTIICSILFTLLITDSKTSPDNTAISTGAASQDKNQVKVNTSIGKIKEEQEKQKVAEETLRKSLSSTIVNNIRKNSKAQVEDATSIVEKKPIIPAADDTRTGQEMIDDITTHVSETGYGTFFSILFALQRISVPASIVISFFCGILAVAYHKNKRVFKFFIFLTIGTPIFFLLIHVLPALYWYTQQK